MTILDKLTPHSPVAEPGAPAASMTIEGQRVATQIMEALKQKGIKLNAADLIPKAPPAQTPLPPKDALTHEEEVLFGRSRTFIANALKAQGISPTTDEIKWLGAAVADFVMAEMKSASEVQVVQEPVAIQVVQEPGTVQVAQVTGE